MVFDQNYFECLHGSDQDTGHRNGRDMLEALIWFMQSFSSQLTLNTTMRNLHPKVDSGGLSFPSSLNFLIFVDLPLELPGSITFHHVENISSTSGRIILSSKVGIFPGKQLC